MEVDDVHLNILIEIANESGLRLSDTGPNRITQGYSTSSFMWALELRDLPDGRLCAHITSKNIIKLTYAPRRDPYSLWSPLWSIPLMDPRSIEKAAKKIREEIEWKPSHTSRSVLTSE